MAKRDNSNKNDLQTKVDDICSKAIMIRQVYSKALGESEMHETKKHVFKGHVYKLYYELERLVKDLESGDF